MLNNENIPSFEVDGETKQPEVSVGIQVGIENHKELKGRDLPNQHPISAISGLQEALDSKAEDGDFVTKDELDKKQDTIEDLETIREGAEKGATAVQPSALGAYATKQELNGKQDKGDYALKSEIPKKVSALENDAGYLTKHQDISGLATKQELAGKQDFISDLPAIRSGSALGGTAVQPSALGAYATKQELGGKQDKGDYALKTEIPKKVSALENDAGYLQQHQDISGLATKQELSGKQDKITDLAEIREGAKKGATAVQPDGIPVKDVQVNGTTILKDGVANIPVAGSGGKLGLVFPAGFGVNVTASGALAINKATDALLSAKANNFQPVVPSNLDYAVKVGVTTNAITLSGTEKATACNWLGAQQISPIQALNATDSITLTDGYIYNGGEQTALTIALPTYADVSFLCEIDFTSGATATTLTYPNSIKWDGTDVNGGVFTSTTSTRYTLLFCFNGVQYVCIVKGIVQ